jgi:ABC-type bacteriocin/lantibiotic exporter with double-glycine peptidase domain
MLVFGFSKRISQKVTTSVSSTARVSALLSDLVSNFVNVKFLGEEDRESRRLNNELEQERRAYMSGQMALDTLGFGQSLVISLLFVGLIFLTILGPTDDASTASITFAYIVGILAYYQLKDFSDYLSQFLETRSKIQFGLEELFSETPRVIPPKNGSVVSDQRSTNYALSLCNVTVSGERGKELLTSFSLDIHPGEIVRLCGESGSGKSTILKTIVGINPVKEGAAYIDSVPVESLSPEEVSRKVTYLEQNARLFNRSLRENLLFGAKDASDQELLQLLSRLRLTFDGALTEHALDYVIGKDGQELSGGERQRIHIARAILRKRDILILDEAMSAIDSETATEAWNILSRELSETTILFVEHRSEALQNAILDRPVREIEV